MDDTALATIERPTRQAIAINGRSARLSVTGKLRKAVDFMVWEGAKTDLKAAAAHAGISTHSLRCALDKPHVKAYYNQQIEVLRTSERARNIHRAVAIRDAADNMPAVQAMRYLDQVPEGAAQSSNVPRQPGVVIVVQGNAAISSGPAADDADKGSVSD